MYMKKLLLLLIVAFALTANANAQSLGSIFGKLKDAIQKDTEKTDTVNSDNEDFKELGQTILGGIVETVVSGKKISAKDISGNWNYEGAACTLESDDKVAEFGAKLVTAKFEKKLNEYLLKVGVEKGKASMQFADDGTCVANIGEKKFNGKYSIGEDGKSMQFSFLADKITLNSVVEYSATGMRVMFDADKVLEIVKKLGTTANEYAKSKATDSGKSSTATMITTLMTMLEGYNGMKLGINLVK